MACLKVSMCCRIYNGDVRLAHASAEPDKAKSTKGAQLRTMRCSSASSMSVQRGILSHRKERSSGIVTTLAKDGQHAELRLCMLVFGSVKYSLDNKPLPSSSCPLR